MSTTHQGSTRYCVVVAEAPAIHEGCGTGVVAQRTCTRTTVSPSSRLPNRSCALAALSAPPRRSSVASIAPSLSATLTQPTGLHMMTPGGAINPTSSHTVSVPLSASVGGAALAAAVGLALLGGLLAGAFGSWRIARLRPADAIAKVG